MSDLEGLQAYHATVTTTRVEDAAERIPVQTVKPTPLATALARIAVLERQVAELTRRLNEMDAGK